MIARVFVALIGAVIITAGLLLAMDSFTSMFRERDSARYFRITDVLARPPPDRPERPAPALRQPDVPRATTELPAARVPVEPPTDFDPAQTAPAPVLELEPDLDLSGGPADD